MNLDTIMPEQTYVALATLLPSDLRPHASCACMCFFQVERSAGGSQHTVRVAALPHRLGDTKSTRVFLFSLSDEQLAQALPWDRPLQALPTCEVREQVEAHVRAVGGTLPPAEPTALPASPVQHEVQFVALPEVFVSCETLQDALTEVDAPTQEFPTQQRRFWMQRVWLRAAVAMLRRQLAHVNQACQVTLHAFLKHLDGAVRSVFVAAHHSQYPLVHASPAYCGDRHVGWHLRIGVPLPLAA